MKKDRGFAEAVSEAESDAIGKVERPHCSVYG